jgi:peptidoglycan/LPS O-acetylase OafA/YrhL
VEPTYRADVDGLRAVAVSAVLGFHAFPSHFSGGFTGVDVFFVISGYLISGILFRELERGRFTFSGFYARRIRRIFPALILVLAALLAFGWFALTADEYRAVARHTSAAGGFLLNFVLWRESGYFDTAARLKPLLHLWSLAIEEQFYLFWPLVLFVSWKWTRGFLGVIVGLLAISFAVNVAQVHSHPETAFFLPLARLWELLTGSLAARLERQARWRTGVRIENAKAVSGALLVVTAIFALDEADAFPGWWALLPTLGTFLLISAGPQAWLNRAVLARRPVVGLGLISYPLYLWHWPLLSLAAMIGLGRVTAAAKLALLALSVLLAWSTYQLVEKPIRFGARRPGAGRADWRTWGPISAMCALVLAALWVGSHKGFPDRFPQAVATTQQARSEREHRVDPDCERFVGLPHPTFDYCRLAKGSSGDVVAIIGDSHGRSLFLGLSERLAERGDGTLLLASTLCPPFAGTTIGVVESLKSECERKTTEILGVVSSKPEIKEVVIATRGALYITGEGFGDVDQQRRATGIVSLGAEQASDRLTTFKEGLRRSVEELERSGKKVSLLLDVPELGFLPMACVGRPRWIRPALACEVSRREVDERQAAYRAMARELEASIPGFTVLDPFPLLCDAVRCRAVDGETLLYEDDDHLSLAGSRLVASRLF